MTMDKRHAVLAGIVMATMFCLAQRVWGAAMEKSVQVTVEAIKPGVPRGREAEGMRLAAGLR